MFLETFYILEMPTTAGRVHFYPKGNGLGYTDTRNREHEEAVFKGNLEEDTTCSFVRLRNGLEGRESKR